MDKVETKKDEKKKASPRRLRLRTLVKLVLLVVVVAILIPVLQILIPAIAYRDELRALLNYSDDCKAPCFMGITPGDTTREEAIAILSANREITYTTEYYPSGSKFGTILVRNRNPDAVTSYFIHFENGTVRVFGINLYDSNITFTTVLLTLGLPDANVYGFASDGGFYLNYGLRVQLTGCEDAYQYFASGISQLEFYGKNSEVYNRLYPFQLQVPQCIYWVLF